jgi:hypothetical protein
MRDEPTSYDFVYVETDIPPGDDDPRMASAALRTARGGARARTGGAASARLAPLTALALALARVMTTGRSHAVNIRDTVPRRRAWTRYPWPRIRSFRRSAG